MSGQRQFVWVRYQNAADHQGQRFLIAARKAIAAEPGTVPEVWPLYTSADKSGIDAEHAVIGIWGTHQQGDSRPVHISQTDENKWPPNFGGACRKLFDAQFDGNTTVHSPLDTMAEDTITKRLAVLSRTDEVPVAVAHITSLIRLMRSTGTHIAFNYDGLFWALHGWTDTDKRTAILYQWSRSYFRVPSTKTTARSGGK